MTIRPFFSAAVLDTWYAFWCHCTPAGFRVLLYLQVAFTRYGEESRRQRRVMARGLGSGRIPQYHPLIIASTRPLLRSLITSSGRDFVPAIRRYAGGLNLSVVYGLEATRDDDPALVKAEGATDLLANQITAGGGLWPVDILPFCACIFPAALNTNESVDRT